LRWRTGTTLTLAFITWYPVNFILTRARYEVSIAYAVVRDGVRVRVRVSTWPAV